MTDSIYTQKRDYQYRGPLSSEQYNLRVEEGYKDLVYLYNYANQLNFDSDKIFSYLLKNILALSNTVDEYDTRLAILESGKNRIGFTSSSQLDTDRFNGGPFNIAESDRCTWDSLFNQLTLPKVDLSSVSKIKFLNEDGTLNTSSNFEMVVQNGYSSADDSNATIDSSQPYEAIVNRPGHIWERNVIVNSPNSNGAIMTMFVKIPTELATTLEVNNINFLPYPIHGADILSIDYTIAPDPALNDSTAWVTLNSGQNYFNNLDAVGHVPPGAWTGDTIINSGAKSFYFDPKNITAMRIKFRQKDYYKESSKYIYSYGLSKLDIRFDKFLDTGKAIIRFDAPNVDVISNVTSVTPLLWNVAEYEVANVISTRVIWETSYNSGSYTTTRIPLSKRVWVEVTLNKTANKASPCLSGLVINYT